MLVELYFNFDRYLFFGDDISRTLNYLKNDY